MKSLSGSGANGLMIDTMKQYGADSFVGRMSCVARGAFGHHILYSCCVFRQRRYHQNEECRDVWLIADFSGIIAASSSVTYSSFKRTSLIART